MDFYHTIDSEGCAEYKDRGSKFLAYTFFIKNKEDFKKYLEKIKKEHAKASHYCFAYRIGYDGNNFRVSDDGEPAGTAGKQILAQIDSKNLCDILIIVVRYFGGILLGVPGLVNAYKATATMALQCTHIIQKPIEIKYNLCFNYTEINEVMRIIKQYNCSVYKNETQLFCEIETGLPKYRLTEILYLLEKIRNIEIKDCNN